MRDFQHCRLWYTRAAHHLQTFRDALPPCQMHHFPLMESRAEALSAAEIQQWQACDALVFTSVNAVRFAPTYANTTEIVAIGEATAEALPRCDVIAPPPFNSEALLGHWQPRGKKIGIVAARGGRNLLQQHLARQNQVDFFYVYQRFNPTSHWPQDAILPDVITIASAQTLNHLLALSPASVLPELKSKTAIAAISPRVAQYAAQHGFFKVFHAETAQESALIQAIIHWWQQQGA